MTSRQRMVGFWLIAAACGLGVLVYSLREVRERAAPQANSAPIDIRAATEVARAAHVLFTNGELKAGNGQLAVASLQDPAGPRRLTSLRCDRVDFAGGTGMCLTANRDVLTTYSAQVFDDSLSKVLHTVPLSGIPSRTRVSPDGAVAAVTVFVAGHSYSGSDFSTQTTLIDTRSGKTIVDLEELAVTRDGKPFKAVDFNFWGVTFPSAPDTFFATLSSGGVFYLIKGDIKGRSANVVGTGVECPSLSPDGTRVAYKKRETHNGGVIWKLAVRSLAANDERVLTGETRSIDDQVEWLDDQHLLYGASDPELAASATSIWRLSVEGGQPERWVPNGFSPSVVRD